MAEVVAQLAVWQRLVGAKLRSGLQYRASFWMFLLSQFMVMCLDLAVIASIFTKVDSLGGWSGMQVALLYGLSGVAFGAAGGHFNPHGAPHGEHARGAHADHHAGDLPNLAVNDDGQGRLNTASAHFTLVHEVAAPLFDDNGSAIVIHANQDDYITQTGPLGPGQSGPRIACGVIEQA